MPAGPSRRYANLWWKGYRAIAAIGKSMVTRSTSANKRLEFRAALHNEAEGNRIGRRAHVPNPVSWRADLFKVLR
jgi:hypothetical protein